MGFDPPGLEHKPDNATLAGFGSLMPKTDPQPGLISRLVRIPFKLIGLPFRVARAVLRIPLRILGIGGTATTSATED